MWQRGGRGGCLRGWSRPPRWFPIKQAGLQPSPSLNHRSIVGFGPIKDKNLSLSQRPSSLSGPTWRSCEREGEEEPFLYYLLTAKPVGEKAPASSLPLVVDSGSEDRKQRPGGGGEGEKAACRSLPPFRNQAVYWQHGHCSGFPLDGDWRGLEDGGLGGCGGVENKAPSVEPKL